MTRGKRTKLQHNGARSRATERSVVVIDGLCVIGERGKETALVTDLGLQGCRVRTDRRVVTRYSVGPKRASGTRFPDRWPLPPRSLL